MRHAQEVRTEVAQREWDRRTRFVERLLGQRGAVEIPLQPPTSSLAGADPVGLRNFREEWEAEAARLGPCGGEVVFETRQLRVLGEQRIPVRLILPDPAAIAGFLGPSAIQRLALVRERLRWFDDVAPSLGRAATRVVTKIEALTAAETCMLVRALQQMTPGMGSNTYLRSLPLDDVDTKFLERNNTLVAAILDDWTEGEVRAQGGLEAWLGCKSKGQDRLLIRPLCEVTLRAFRGARSCWVTSEDLLSIDMPGNRLLIIENETPAFELPTIDGCVAVAGCGGNLAWLTAGWLPGRRIGYWGDIDSWGLQLLSVARGYRPELTALLMDDATWQAHPAAVVREETPYPRLPSRLSVAEANLFHGLAAHAKTPARLEQEKLAPGAVRAALTAWSRGD